MSALGEKAGEEIRTPDVQLGKRKARLDNARFSKWLWVLFSAGAQLGAGRLARSVPSCHPMAILARSPVIE